MQIPLFGKKVNPWLIGLFLVGILGSGAIAYRALTNVNTKPDAIANSTVPVKSEALEVKIKASGTIVPVQTVNLSPKTQSKLVRLLVEQGDSVSAGQVVALMDDANIRPQISQAEASLANAEANLAKLRSGNRIEDIAAAKERLESARARAELSSARLKRNRNLVTQGAITRDRLDELMTNDEAAQANVRELQRQLELLQKGFRAEEIAQAEAQVAEAKARLRIIQVQREDTIIRSPFDGIVTQKYATEGAFVSPSTSASATSSATSTSIVAVANGLEILAKVPEVDISQIKVGQKVEVIADAFPDQVFAGNVRLIAPESVVEQNVTSFQVRVTLNTGKDRLKSGMNTDLKFIGQRIANALVVPTVAIVTENGQVGLYIPDETQKAKFRPVTIGITVENQTQILKGANANERVFIKLPESKQFGEQQNN